MSVTNARISSVFNLKDFVQSIGPAVTEQNGDRTLDNKDGNMINFAKEYM
jgi:hypothetical protein